MEKMIQLFFSYSHKDEAFRIELGNHLTLLKRQGIISTWHDRCISAGRDIEEEIYSELDSSHIILLLVSSNLLASDYCYEKEMAHALKKHKEGSAVVIPVIIHPCDWQDAPFRNLRATPTDGKAVSMYENRHEAFTIIAKDVREAISNFTELKNDQINNQSNEDLSSSKENIMLTENIRIKRKFSDLDRNKFIEECYIFFVEFFEKSLVELSEHNPHVETKFKQSSENGFSAFAYTNGDQVAQCSIYYGEGNLFPGGIAFSNSGKINRHSFNELLSIEDDGYALKLKPMGMLMLGIRQSEYMSQKDAAEYLWSAFIRPMQ